MSKDEAYAKVFMWLGLCMLGASIVSVTINAIFY